MPVSIKIELVEDLAQLGFDGKIFARDTGSDGSGTLRVSGPDLAALAEAMGVGSAQSFASDKFSLKAEAVLSETGLTLDELQIRLGETQANGTIAYLTGTPARLDATLKINRFDLDKITQNGAADRGAADTKQQVPGEAGTASSESSKPGGARDAAPETGVDVYLAMLPADLAASIDLEVQTLRYLGGVVQQAHAVLSLDEGVITIQQATALLPGGSNVALFGQISPSEGGARFDGQVEMASDDVRAVISWLNLLDASDLPADRLRRFSLTAGLSTDATGGELSALDLRIDASRLQGYANFALGTRNILDANLHLDRLNADAYLAAATTSEQGDATPDAGTETAAQPTGGGEASAPSAAVGGGTAHRAVDADQEAEDASGNLEGSVGSVDHRNVPTTLTAAVQLTQRTPILLISKFHRCAAHSRDYVVGRGAFERGVRGRHEGVVVDASSEARRTGQLGDLGA